MSYCIDCGDDFRYDDCGGYNPPCECGAHCRSCHDATEREMEDEFDDYCDEHDPESGSFCCLPPNHSGSHQSQLCNATCDSCDCVEWNDEPVPTSPEKASVEHAGPAPSAVSGGDTE